MLRILVICTVLVAVLSYPSGHGGEESLGSLGDYHGGISIISGGSGGHGKTIDLTHHGKDQHSGAYGGTFISSSKYNHADGHEGHDHGHYASVLGASDQGSSGGNIEVHEDLSDVHEALLLAGHH